MPLFMDLHKAEDYGIKPTIEEIKHNHIADLKTQAKYNVRFIQYWINEEAGLVFCLMEAPDKESCMATHQEAHGNMPCRIIELKGGDYQIFMGDGRVNEFDITENMEGGFDTGHRSILVAEIISVPYKALPYETFKKIIRECKGREAGDQNGRVRTVFNKASQAIACARKLQQAFMPLKEHGVEIRIGISFGEPVTAHDHIFASAVQMADWLCDISRDGQISVSPQVMESSKASPAVSDGDPGSLQSLSHSDEKFLKSFMSEVEPMLTSERISMEKLSRKIGISQPQLYRKVTMLSGHSPNSLIQEMKLKKALRLVNQKFGNIAEIAFESGYNSPSYFSKSFQKRFGTLPATVLKSI